MILGEKFVWGHLGRTAGDTTLKWFVTHFSHLVVDYHEASNPQKHRSFASAPDWCKDRILVANLRRLPAWLVSFAAHRYMMRQSPDKVQSLVSGPWKPVDVAGARCVLRSLGDAADVTLGNLVRNLQVDVWLRQEFLADDFIAFVSRFDSAAESKRPLLDVTLAKGYLRYDHSRDFWFTDAELRAAVRNNPVWWALEQRIYS